MKTKIFLSDKVTEMENLINGFINEKSIEIVNLKMCINLGQIVCLIIYSENNKNPTE